MRESEAFRTVATYSGLPEAHLAKNFLDENGIQAFVIDEHLAGLPGFGVWVEAKLQVAAADAERAKELLSRDRSP